MLVTTHIAGGLGNQLFQIANVLSYCSQYNYKPFFINDSPTCGIYSLVNK